MKSKFNIAKSICSPSKNGTGINAEVPIKKETVEDSIDERDDGALRAETAYIAKDRAAKRIKILPLEVPSELVEYDSHNINAAPQKPSTKPMIKDLLSEPFSRKLLRIAVNSG